MLNMGQRQTFIPVRKNKVILRCAPPETEENIESGGATTPESVKSKFVCKIISR